MDKLLRFFRPVPLREDDSSIQTEFGLREQIDHTAENDYAYLFVSIVRFRSLRDSRELYSFVKLLTLGWRYFFENS